MTRAETTDSLYDLKAKIMKALSHPTRLKIVDFLCCGEKCVCEIVENIAGERTGISKHLSILQNAGIISSKKEGLKVIYKIDMECVTGFFSCAEKILKKAHEKKGKALRGCC